MLEPLKRYRINPKTRSRDGHAVKLHPLTSCDPQAIEDALANSTLRGPQADTLLLVAIPSTRSSHTWTLTPIMLSSAPIPPFHFHSAWQDPAQPMWTNPERHRSSSAPAQPNYFSTTAPTVRDDLLNVQADGRLAAHLRETPAPHIMEVFSSWMLHGSTKVVVRAVAVLSANTRINRMSLLKVIYVSESNN